MKFGEGWSLRWPRQGLPARVGLGLALWLVSGCASGPAHFDQSLMADKGAPLRNRGVTAVYRIHCPDVVEIGIESRPELSGRRQVEPDGRIDLGNLGKMRVEGHSVPEVAFLLADALGIAPDQVHLKVTEFKSQQVYLYGQVIGWQRTLPYQGPETVLDLLQRAGGVTPGAASNHVYVVRTRIAEGKPPEVFPINLQAIVANKNSQTNLRLQPFDQVYVGEARKATLEKLIPPVFRPVYEIVCGMRRRGGGAAENPFMDPAEDSALVRKPLPQDRPTIRGKAPLPENQALAGMIRLSVVQTPPLKECTRETNP